MNCYNVKISEVINKWSYEQLRISRPTTLYFNNCSSFTVVVNHVTLQLGPYVTPPNKISTLL